MKLTILACFAAASTLSAQTAPAAPDLAASRAFVHALPADRAAAGTFLQAVGRERAEAMLMQVYIAGNSAQASLDDWGDLHRALTGLVTLFSQQSDPTDLFRASVFANIQDFAYRDKERDYGRALEAAEESLALAERSGLTQNIFLNWANIGRELLNVGRIDEALADLRKSRDLIPTAQMYSDNASQVWRDIVDIELARQNISGASQELIRFQETALPAPPYFRAQAQLAKADLEMAQDQYGDVPGIVSEALQSVLDPADKATFGYDAVLELMRCILDSMNRLSYQDALGLAAKIDRDVPGLPIQVSGFAQRAARSRRRMSGDIEGILREDSTAVEQAQKAGNAHGQVEALRILAADFAAAGSLPNQITAMEQAVALERMLHPDGIPLGYPEGYAFAGTLAGLASAYARTAPFGPAERTKADQLLSEAAAAIDKQPAAADRTRLASLRAEIQLEQAEVLALKNKREDARKILTAAIEDSGAGRYDKADVYMRLARLDREEAPDVAAVSYDLAIREFRSRREALPEVAAHVEAARALARKDLYDKAQAHLDEAAKSTQNAGFADAEWKLPYVAGMIFEGKAQPNQAVDAYREAVKRVEALRAGLGEEERPAFTDSEWVSDLYARLISALTDLGRHQEAWQYTERGKARTFVESLEGRKFKETAPPKAQGELAEMEKRMIALRLQLAPDNDLLFRSSGGSASTIKSQLTDLENRFTLLREREGLANSRASQAVVLEPPMLGDLQASLKKLDPNAVLIEYSMLPDRITAFLIGPASFQQVTWKADVDALENDLRELRGLFEDQNSAQELGPLLARIAQTVWQPVAGKLPSGTRRLVIAPTGFLNYLPFQTLPFSGGPQLIDRFTISYLPSASTLMLLGGAAPLKGDLFLGALGSVQVEGAPPLPGTTAEVDGIARVYPGATLIKEQALTHDAALQALLDHQAVHFATHGIYDVHAPLFSALLTSPASGQPARVSLYELTGMQLKAKLVVLSACESGTGKLMQGDEISGLARTILSAGAKTVVSSLWDVDDASTALLMQQFYAGLHKGKSPAAALRAAALVVRKKYPHPMFWAPFVVTGAF
jgi:CHAT domain-containing protein/tetratricopeptide (TPR) repeat protein